MNAAFQTALYSHLTADTALMAAITGVHDDVPQDSDSNVTAPFPFVTIGDGVISDWATDDWSGGEAVTRVHVWSRYAGRKEALEILDLIRARLDRASLTIAGFDAVTCDFQSSFVDLDPDGETRHGVIEFRVLITI